MTHGIIVTRTIIAMWYDVSLTRGKF